MLRAANISPMADKRYFFVQCNNFQNKRPNFVTKIKLKAALQTQSPLAIAGMVLLLLASLFVSRMLYNELILGPTEGNLRAVASAKAPSLANIVNHFVAQQQQSLNTLVARPLIARSLKANREDRGRVENSLLSLLKGAERIQLVAAQDSDLEQRLNFVALDMARRLLRGEHVLPEAMKHNQRWHILLAETVSSDPPGALIASFPAEQLATTLGQTFDSSGQIRVVQEYDGVLSQPFVVVGTAATGVPEASAPTNLPHWRVQYSPGTEIVESLQPEFGELVIFYTALAITGFLFVWISLRAYLKYRSMITTFAAKKAYMQQNKEAVSHHQPEGPSETFELNEAPRISGSDHDKHQPGSTEHRSHIPTPLNTPAKSTSAEIPKSIFRAYDIRGLYGSEVSDAFAKQLGQTLGTLVLENEEAAIAVAHDGRISSPALYESLLAGIQSTGCDVIALGLAPTPLMNFAINHLDDTSSGVCVTASHNPPEYNGFKIVINGKPLCGEPLHAIYQRITNGDCLQGDGDRRALDLRVDYIERITSDSVPAHNLRVVVDAANGASGPIAPVLLEHLGCTVHPIYCEVDGNFPNHLPDTAIADNLQDLIDMVKHHQADLGIALDGDGDRLVAITASGRIVWPDELLMLFARDVLGRQPGADIVFDVKCTRRLSSVIGAYGGRPMMWKTGHSHMREKVAELNAPLGGEYSGHLFFNDRWYGFDDGLYAAARLIEIISLREQSLDDMLETLPSIISTGELQIPVAEHRKFSLIDDLIAKGDFKDGKLTTLDGLRIDFASGWGLVRASNTSPALTLRFEGDTTEDLEAVRQLINEQLLAIEPSLPIDTTTTEKENVLEP